jgi:hypothetical protein
MKKPHIFRSCLEPPSANKQLVNNEKTMKSLTVCHEVCLSTTKFTMYFGALFKPSPKIGELDKSSPNYKMLLNPLLITNLLF